MQDHSPRSDKEFGIRKRVDYYQSGGVYFPVVKMFFYISRGRLLMISPYLKLSFIVHFLADIISAIPLFLFPEKVLLIFGWTTVDPVSARLVAAALFGIGGVSLLARNATRDVYITMLNLKIIWSFFAVIALSISVAVADHGRPPMLIAALLIFIAFHALWVFWRIHIARKPE
jgi:hypothetical protein